MKDLVAGTKDTVAKGMTEEQAAQSIDFSKYKGEFPPNFDAFNAAAIQRAYDEAAGKIKD